MALQSSDHHGELSQSSQALLDKLDELLVDSVPKEVENTSHDGVDYNAGLNEMKRVSMLIRSKVNVNIIYESLKQVICHIIINLIGGLFLWLKF
jgi:hypothetical protein